VDYQQVTNVEVKRQGKMIRNNKRYPSDILSHAKDPIAVFAWLWLMAGANLL